MKTKQNSILNFIKDFKLQKKEELICFDAIIFFTTASLKIQMPSEVQIVHLQSIELDVVYLLTPDVATHNIPSVFDSFAPVEYFKNEYLFVKGSSPQHGKYVLAIHPLNTFCSPATLEELYAKAYN